MAKTYDEYLIKLVYFSVCTMMREDGTTALVASARLNAKTISLFRVATGTLTHFILFYESEL